MAANYGRINPKYAKISAAGIDLLKKHNLHGAYVLPGADFVSGKNGIALKNAVRAAIGLKKAPANEAAAARTNLHQLNNAIATTARETVELAKSLGGNEYKTPGYYGGYSVKNGALPGADSFKGGYFNKLARARPDAAVGLALRAANAIKY
jgi:hypothetical protein